MDYVKALETEYLKRKQKNQRYSIRAFSNFLGIQSSTLSAVFKKTRHLSLKDAEEIAARLFDNGEDSREFLLSFLKEKSTLNNEQFVPDDAAFFPLLTDWEYGAIITLMDTYDFCSNSQWIAQRLNIQASRVEKILEHLLKVEFIFKDEAGKLVKSHKSFQTSEDVNSLALRIAHQEELKLALTKQAEVDILDREFGSMMMAIEKNKLPQLKKKIREFIDQTERTFETENADEVYFLTYQLFPLTTDIKKTSESLQ